MSYSSWTRECGIAYEAEAQHFRSNGHGLLLANRLLRAETKHEFRGMGAPSYSLDVVIMPAGELRPRWTHIPWVTTQIHTLTITFTVADFASFDTGLYYFPISRAWAIYSVLERFIALGPAVPGPPMAGLAPTVLRPTCQMARLVLSSEAPSDGLPPSRRDFVDVLRARFAEMTWTSLPTHPYAALLLSHIGSVEFRRGGETLVTWHLDDSIQATDPGRYGRPRFRIKQGGSVRHGMYEEWRAAILEVRREKGLSRPDRLVR